ncbi:MAG: FG-GAP repeat protein [Bdellovibrionales bacterium]|nr:FG-GAP repeat protein [Bdellovibrionales bacterium]
MFNLRKIWIIIFCLTIFLRSALFAQGFPKEVRGSASGDEFGYSVACSSDKVLVGIPGKDGSNTNLGAVRVYNSFSSSFNEIAFPGSPSSNARFGHSVAFTKDITGDFKQDILVGAPGDFAAGAVYVFSSAQNASPFFTFFGTQTGENLGHSVIGLNDLNSDGRAEIAIGAPTRDEGGNNDGAVDVLDPNAAGSIVIANFTGQNGEQLGFSLANGRNLAGTNPSLVAGAPFGTNHNGRIYVYNLSTQSQIGKIEGPSASQDFGYSVDLIPDVTGDGVYEILVGAPASSTGSGSAYLFSGSSINTAAPRVLCELSELEAGSKFGYSVKFLGDVNGDRRPDFAVGTPNSNSIGSNQAATKQGGIYIYTYRAFDSSCPLLAAIGGFERTNEEFGVAIAGGDKCNRNLNSNNDFVVATKSDVNGTDSGSIVYYEGDDFDIGLPPDDVDFSFRISRNGVFAAILDFNRDPQFHGCTSKVLGRYQLGKKIGDVFEIAGGEVRNTRNNVAFAGLKKSAVVDGVKPILHLVVQVDCGTERVYSNVFARYMNCDKEGVLLPDAWIKDFKDIAENFELKPEHDSATNSNSKLDKVFKKLRKNLKNNRKTKKKKHGNRSNRRRRLR